jgi:hypothetical protein
MLLTGQHHYYSVPVDVKPCMWSLLASQRNRVASPVVHALHGSIFLILVPWIHYYYLACKIVSTFGLWTGNLLDWTANGVVQGCTSIHQTVTPRSQLRSCLVEVKMQKVFKTFRHVTYVGICMEH